MQTSPTSQVLQEVTNACIRLMMAEPFYGHFFQGVAREVHERVATMAIGITGNRIKLHINPRFWRERLTSEDLQYGLVKHEILHVVFKHIFRSREFSHQPVFNVACDLVVNQYIKKSQLPEDHIHLDLFPTLELLPEMHSDYYYEKLIALHEKMTSGGGGGTQPAQSGEIQGEGEDRDESDGDAESRRDESWENLKKIIGEGNEWQESHTLWADLDELPAALRDLIEQSIDQSIENTLTKMKGSNTWGELPEGLKAWLEDFERSRHPTLDWKRVLRMFAETSSRTFLKNTVRRPSKRYGTTPGIKVRRRQKLLVAIDTSGSVSADELHAFFSEIYHIYKRGSEVTVVECDAAIHKTYLYKGHAPETISGRGGTNFTPPIAYANNVYHPDAIVYFTDGFAPPPSAQPRCPILWLVSAQGAEVSSGHYQDLPGRKVKMVAENRS